MVSNLKIIAIIQARMSSKRLPGKVMKDLLGETVLDRVVNKAKLSKYVNEVWLATSNDSSDDVLKWVSEKHRIPCYRGSLNNVLLRFCDVIRITNADIIVRITADNPFTEPSFIDKSIEILIDSNSDYITQRNIPYGTGSEVIRKEALLISNTLAKEIDDREHVTKYILDNREKFIVNFIDVDDYLSRPDIRLTIDTFEDYLNILKLLLNIKTGYAVPSLEEIIFYLDKNPSK